MNRHDHLRKVAATLVVIYLLSVLQSASALQVCNEYCHDIGLSQRSRDFVRLEDGRFVVVGTHDSNDGFIARFNPDLQTPEFVTFEYGDEPEEAQVEIYGVSALADGRFAVCGYLHPDGGNDDAYVLILDEAMNIEHYDTFYSDFDENGENDRDEVAYDLIETSDGGLLVVGKHGSGSTLWAFKLDETLSLEDEIEISGMNVAYGVVEDSDGGYVLVGEQADDIYWVKLDENLQQVGQLHQGPASGSFNAEARVKIAAVDNGGFVIVGEGDIHGVTTSDDALVIRLSQNLQSMWTPMYRYWGGSGNDYALGVAIDGDSIVVVGADDDSQSGSSGSSPFLLKYSLLNGDLGTAQVFDEPGHQNWAVGVARLDSGCYVIAAFTGNCGSGTDSDLKLMIIDNDCPPSIAEPDANVPSVFALSAYPNPFNPTTQIEFDTPRPGNVRLAIFDLLGREVALLLDQEMTAGRIE